ncbi:MAG: RNA methyltransferase [Parafilimonas sp.]
MLSRNEVKYIQSLRHKKNRDEDDLFIAEGVKIVDELINADFVIKNMYAVKDWIDNNQTINNVIEVSDDELKKISNFETPNKVLAVVTQNKSTQIPVLKNKITLLLDGIQDPGNLGTIIRTADWFGVENIIASTDTADMYNPKVVQATMGSIARVNVFYTDVKTFLSTNTIMVCAAVLNGENISTINKINECILVIGNESKGIRENIQPYIQKKISVQKIGNAESLNAAVATGIILFKLTEHI